MKNAETRIKKELEDFHKTVSLDLYSHKNLTSKFQSFRMISGIGRDLFPALKILYIKEAFIK